MAKKKIQQTTLFGMDTDDREPLLMFDVSSRPEYKQMIDLLNKDYTMDGLEKIASSFRKIFRKYKICDAENPKRPIPCMAKLIGGLKYKKDYLALIANVLSCRENFQIYFSMLDQPTQDMWDYLFLHIYASGEQLEKATGTKWITKETRRYYYSEDVTVCHDHGWPITCLSVGYYNSKTFLALTDTMWNLYAMVVFPTRYEKFINCDGIEEVPDTLFTYSNEQNVGMQMSVIRQLLQQDAIEFGAKKMTASMVKKVAKQLNFPEFFPDAKDNSLKQLAAALAVPMLATYLHRHPEADLNEWHTVVKTFFQKCSMSYVLFDMLSHLSGLHRDEVVEGTNYDKLDNLLQHTLSTLTPGRWLDVSDLLLKMYATKDLDRKSLAIIYPSMFDRRNIYSGNERMYPYDSYYYVELPVMYGYLALYASCGLIEIAYGSIRGVGAYSFIKFVRLTKLGEYVLGLTETYKVEGMHHPTEYFEADDSRLIIRSILIDGKNPYEGIITRIAERISDNRYRVTPATFLAGCNSFTDIEQKEKFFSDNICKQPPAVWTTFFEQMTQRCNPLLPTAEQYTVRRINPANRELLQLFANDAYLRKHTLRGENFTIMIEVRFLAKVEEKLRSYGYLI